MEQRGRDVSSIKNAGYDLIQCRPGVPKSARQNPGVNTLDGLCTIVPLAGPVNNIYHKDGNSACGETGVVRARGKGKQMRDNKETMVLCEAVRVTQGDRQSRGDSRGER